MSRTVCGQCEMDECRCDTVRDKPEALRLAEELGVPFQCDFHVVCEEASAELRRLHEENKRLRDGNGQLRRLATDAVEGLRYVRETYGDLRGVGWDRVFAKESALQSETAIWSARNDPRE